MAGSELPAMLAPAAEESGAGVGDGSGVIVGLERLVDDEGIHDM